MCKFNQFFVLFVCCVQLIQITVTSPLGTLLFDDYVDEEAEELTDYHYDERQNGTENYRLNINGVVIAVPAASSSAMSSIGLLASNYLLELAEAAAAGQGSNDGLDDVGSENPYDFEVPSGSEENDNVEPVVIISADGINKPSKPTTSSDDNESSSLSTVQDLKPENTDDAANEKESSTNKKDLNVEIVKDTENLTVSSDKPAAEEVKNEKVTVNTRQVSPKVGMKRRNKYLTF